ncbi:unnamed protein product [Polarella glacialis]|uniref:Uncharacterized protein n=1 Tax=Polarella glacialis TaxID=89957 RepID=A0A813I3P7_POLGL|nr:unnamed protein product [Polarella glacialis]
MGCQGSKDLEVEQPKVAEAAKGRRSANLDKSSPSILKQVSSEETSGQAGDNLRGSGFSPTGGIAALEEKLVTTRPTPERSVHVPGGSSLRSASRNPSPRLELGPGAFVLKTLKWRVWSNIRLIQASKTCRRAASDMLAGHTALERLLLQPSLGIKFHAQVPMALIETGRREDAERLLKDSSCFDKAREGQKELHPHLLDFWICWAATLLGNEALAESCYARLLAFRHPVTGSGLAFRPYGECKVTEWVADLLSTAMLAKASLLRGRRELALAAGDSMARAVAANRRMMMRQHFCLRWSFQEGFIEESGPDLCVLAGQTHGSQGAEAELGRPVHEREAQGRELSGQRYDRLGFPALVLLEVAEALRKDHNQAAAAAELRSAAKELLAFLRACHGIFDSPLSGAVAVAFAMSGDIGAAERAALGTANALGREEEGSPIDEFEAAVWLSQAAQLIETQAAIISL